jgi:hypothetical protein
MVHCYASYFVAPTLLACILYWRGQHALRRRRGGRLRRVWVDD